MSADVFYITQGDRLPWLGRVLLDGEGSPIDLSGADSVKLIGETAGGYPAIDILCEKPVTVGGQVIAKWGADDTAKAGSIRAKYVIAWPGGLEQSVPSNGALTIIIDPAPARAP